MPKTDPVVVELEVSLSNQTVDSITNWQLPLLAVLFVSVIFVAVKTVVHRHESRSLFMQLQKLEKERDALSAQWSRLKLEQGATMNQVRVEQQARGDLGMKMPKASEIKVVREPIRLKNREAIAQNNRLSNKVVLSD